MTVGCLKGEQPGAPAFRGDLRALGVDDLDGLISHVAHDLPADGGIGIQQPVDWVHAHTMRYEADTHWQESHRIVSGMSQSLTIEEVMAILPATPARIAALTEGLTRAQLHTSPETDSWSANDVLAHLRACHDVLGGSVLRILAEDHPTWKGMNPRAWLKKTDYPDWEFQPAFEAFTEQRAELLAVLEPLPAEAWLRTATVIGMIGETYERTALYFGDWMTGHERAHLKSLPRIIAEVRREK